MKFERLGWIVAAALAGGIAGMGFQGSSEKTGTVDLARVFNDSDYAKKQTETLRNMGSARQGVLEFVRTYQHIKPEDASRFHDISVKVEATAAEKAEMERIKQDAIASEAKYRELTTKDKPSAAELSQLEELNRRKDSVQSLLEKWASEFTGDVQSRQETLRNETLARVKDAVQQVAKQQGYTIVFVQDVAPYSANDMTDAALKAMNAKK